MDFNTILSHFVITGEVQEVKPSDKHTQALMAYNQKLKEDPRIDTVLLPIRDGITISRVK